MNLTDADAARAITRITLHPPMTIDLLESEMDSGDGGALMAGELVTDIAGGSLFDKFGNRLQEQVVIR